jgi:hypothetical protein
MAPTACRRPTMPRNTALPTTKVVTGTLKRIPGILLGILFLCLTASTHAGDLAWDLYEEGNWSACSVEAQRLLLNEPTNEFARFLLASSAIRQNRISDSIPVLSNLAEQATTPEIRARAALDLSRLQTLNGHPQEAWTLSFSALTTTSDSRTFFQALSLMHQARRHSGIDLQMDSSQEMQFLTCERLLRNAPESLRPPTPDSLARRIGSAPGKLIVSFYRTCIRPVLGDRCSLSPSCSEYLLQASHHHGLIALPMIADRLVREPSVVAAARHPSVTGRRTVYLDPVEAHDFWMENP